MSLDVTLLSHSFDDAIFIELVDCSHGPLYSVVCPLDHLVDRVVKVDLVAAIGDLGQSLV